VATLFLFQLLLRERSMVTISKEQQQNWAVFIATQADVTPMAFGFPGIAKTDSFGALAAALARVFVPFYCSSGLPEDLGGYPVVSEFAWNKETVRCMDKLLPREFARAIRRPCLVVFDEMSDASPGHQAAVQERIRKGFPGSLTICCGNRPEHSSGGYELTAPVTNRLMIVDWELPSEGVAAGWRRIVSRFTCECGWVIDEALTKNLATCTKEVMEATSDVDQNGNPKPRTCPVCKEKLSDARPELDFPKPITPILPHQWTQWMGEWGGQIASFVDDFPDLLIRFPDNPADACGKPFPSPRSWTNGLRCLAGGSSVGANEVTMRALLKGCVGTAAASLFWEWRNNMSLPNPEDILANPTGWDVPKRGDLVHAVAQTLKTAVIRNSTPDRWEAAMDAACYLATKGREEIATLLFAALWLPVVRNTYNPRVRTEKWHANLKANALSGTI